MSSDQSINLISAAVCLLLVISALASRRLPVGQTVKMALAWVAIFAVGFVIASVLGLRLS